MSDVVDKLWSYCHALRHEGIGYTEYIEQLSFLLFLKLADEMDRPVPSGCRWTDLRELAGPELIERYDAALKVLRESGGFVGSMFVDARSLFTKPVTLKRLLEMIDEVKWTELDVDVKGAAYEGLLHKAASEGKKGAGQFFTPRPLIRSIVRCVKPNPLRTSDFTVVDPACGTGGFLLTAYEWLLEETGAAFKRKDVVRIRTKTYHGQDNSNTPRRLALMNLYLHGLQPNITRADSIYDPPGGARYDCVITNPPFGSRGAGEIPTRDDFTIATTNKQLNFLQHILTILKPGGRAAVVLPDDCLFKGDAAKVMRILMRDCNVHTLLRLTEGTFSPYTGTKANVLFFQKGPPTERLWIYDARTNVPSITKIERPLREDHFTDFEACYGEDANGRSPRSETGPEGRFRSFDIDFLRARDFNLDIRWLKESRVRTAEELPEPEAIVQDLLSALTNATAALEAIETGLESGSPLKPASEPDAVPESEPSLSVPKLIEQLRQSILSAALRGSLTAAWREAHGPLESIHERVAATPTPESGARGRPATKRVIPGLAALSVGMPDIPPPPGWAWFPLTRVAGLESGHTPSRKVSAYWGGEYPWIGIGDAAKFHGGTISETSESVTQEGIDNSATRLLPPGTVCLSRTASIGYVVITGREMCTSQDFVNWVCSPALVPEFLALLLIAERPILHRFASGVSHNTIYFPEVKALHVCLPPVAEQEAVVSTVRGWLGRLNAVARMLE